MAYTYTVQRIIHAGYSIPGTQRTGYPGLDGSGFQLNIQAQFNACGHHSDAVIKSITVYVSWSGTPPAATGSTLRPATPAVGYASFYNAYGYGREPASWSRRDYGSITTSGGGAAITVGPDLTRTEWVALQFTGTTASSWPATISIKFTYESSVAPASTFNCGNATLGSAHTVSIQAVDSSVNHRITWSIGSYSHSENAAAGVGSVSYTIPESWGSAFSTANSGTLTVKLETMQGTAVTGTNTQSKTASVPNYSPSASLAASIVDPVNGGYGQYKSRCRLTPTVTTRYGATITSCTITGHAISGSISGTSGGTTGVLTKSGEITYTLTARDSRGKTVTATRTITVTSVGAVTITQANSLTCGETSTVKFEHVYLSRLTCTVTWRVNASTYHTETLAKGTGTASYTIPTSWANQIQDYSGDLTITIISRDENGDSTGTATQTVTLMTPSYSIDVTASVTKVGAYQGLLLQGRSKVTLSCTATTYYGASITKYQWTGSKIVADKSGASFTTDILDTPGNYTIEVKATDTRGRTGTATVSFTVTEYREPQILSVNAYRSNSLGEEDIGGESLSVITRYTWTDLDVNTLSTTAELTLADTPAQWETLGTGFDSGELRIYKVGQLSKYQKYIVRVTVSDGIATVLSQEIRITVGLVYMYWGEDNFGFGAYPVSSNCFYVGDHWTMYVHGKEILDLIYPVHCVIMRDQATDVAAELGFGTWSLVTSGNGIYYYSRTA